MVKKNLLIILVFSIFFSIFSNVEKRIVDKIATLLIEEYDRYKNVNLIEKSILKLGRPAFIDSVNIWKDNYNQIDTMEIELHPTLERLAEKVDKNSSNKTANYFRNLLEELTYLGYKNLQFYYKALLENNPNIKPENITIQLIDDSICNMKYYDKKMALYEKETVIKSEIKRVMSKKELKSKMMFYILAFNFLNRIRENIIEKDMENMKKKIEE